MVKILVPKLRLLDMSFIRSIVVLLVTLFAASCGWSDKITIIGTGNVGSALGPAFAAQGYEIVYGSRDPARQSVSELVTRTGENASAASIRDAANEADIIVLAVPWSAARETVRQLGDVSGKIIIDVTNPARYNSDGLAERTVSSSNGELIQDWAPRAKVVKAFNTLSYRTMANPASANGPVTIPIVGNDESAKEKVAELAESIGFEPIDLGPIEYAHELEGMLLLWLNARRATPPAFDFYLRQEQ